MIFQVAPRPIPKTEKRISDQRTEAPLIGMVDDDEAVEIPSAA